MIDENLQSETSSEDDDSSLFYNLYKNISEFRKRENTQFIFLGNINGFEATSYLTKIDINRVIRIVQERESNDDVIKSLIQPEEPKKICGSGASTLGFPKTTTSHQDVPLQCLSRPKTPECPLLEENWCCTNCFRSFTDDNARDEHYKNCIYVSEIDAIIKIEQETPPEEDYEGVPAFNDEDKQDITDKPDLNFNGRIHSDSDKFLRSFVEISDNTKDIFEEVDDEAFTLFEISDFPSSNSKDFRVFQEYYSSLTQMWERNLLGGQTEHNRIVRKTYPKRLCVWCGKEFENNGLLNNHMRTHTREKPFTCSICGKSFAENGNHMKHKRNIHFKKKLGQNTMKSHCRHCDSCPKIF